MLKNYIGDSINSVLGQTFPDWELIIVDDCSTDGTGNIIRNYLDQDPRIKCVRHSVNQGVGRARNTGISAAAGEYVAFLDSDDLWLPDKLEKQIGFMGKYGSEFSFSRYRQFRDNPAKAGRLVDVPDVVDYRTLLRGNQIGCLTVVIKRAALSDLCFPSIGHEDYALWLRILRRGAVARGIKEDLARYRLSGKSLSGNKLRAALWTWRIYRDAEKLTLPRSSYYFCHFVWNGIKKHYI